MLLHWSLEQTLIQLGQVQISEPVESHNLFLFFIIFHVQPFRDDLNFEVMIRQSVDNLPDRRICVVILVQKLSRQPVIIVQVIVNSEVCDVDSNHEAAQVDLFLFDTVKLEWVASFDLSDGIGI